MGLSETVFICVDCEATGLDVDNDRIVEVGAVRFTLDEVLGTMETLIDPGQPIPADSTAIHNITDEMVKGKPPFTDVAKELLEFLGRSQLIGHGILYDLNLIDKECKRGNIPANLSSRHYIDTLRLARAYGESPRNSLEMLREHFHIPAEKAHRALDDALVNMKVFKELIRPYKTVKQIQDVLSRPIRLKAMPLGKHKARSFKEIPVDYLKWAAHQNFDQDLLFSLREEIKRRRSGKTFGAAANPFGDL